MILSLIIFLTTLSILVLVHELGHFLAARRAGVWVEEFGFGLPPRIFGKRIGETIYSINLLPFGGFVRLHGENTEDSITRPERAFLSKSKSKRAVIIFAGVLMNFILAVVAFSIVYSLTGIPREGDKVRIVEIKEGSPAQVSGLKINDVVKEVEEVKVSSTQEFIKKIEERKGKETTLLVDREGRLLVIKTTPRQKPPEGEGALGVLITNTEIYFPPIWLRLFYGVFYGFKEALFWGKIVVDGFVKIFTELFGGVVPKDLAGPIGIFVITTQAAKFGFLSLLNFLGILSVNLAILNAVPFPALDGGRLLFVIIEGFLGRRVVPKVEAAIHTVGMVILIILIIAITAHDIQRLLGEGGITGYINSVLK